MADGMNKKILVSAFGIFAFSAAVCYLTRAQSVYTINLDIGKDIAATAKHSGAPRFDKESHWGLQFYEIVDMPLDIPVQFSRPGHEIIGKPLFSILMSADSENNNDMAVETITMQFSRHVAKSHVEARTVIFDLLAQFRKGKWKRYVSVDCPAVSGRSSYLNKEGKIDYVCPLDPDFVPTMEDWLQLMKMPQWYEWVGDGVLARLTVGFDEDDTDGNYRLELEFEDLAIRNRRNQTAEARRLAEGDKKGWKSTERYHQEMKENEKKNRVLEANAVGRGDHLVTRE